MATTAYYSESYVALLGRLTGICWIEVTHVFVQSDFVGLWDSGGPRPTLFIRDFRSSEAKQGSSNQLLLEVPRSGNKRWGDCAFSVFAPRL